MKHLRQGCALSGRKELLSAVHHARVLTQLEAHAKVFGARYLEHEIAI